MSINGPANPPSDDGWGGCSSSSSSDSESEAPSGPAPLAEFDDDTAYPTVDALQVAVNAFTKNVGYAVARHRGKKKKGTDRRLRFASRSGMSPGLSVDDCGLALARRRLFILAR
ncbi:hypothetical protein CONLIGDRAFT_636095 [Coniochaeta ligniaria NRRL 30616]|uniref:Uncharacterized protein n=1 Tax=Coniochaeta ligniaria NRRL 30616 TaxID=1408157 RepID=A0A1J7IBY9_9PEZI|nr:hypothetical protein CONLIGDRAFT_636095 [Coniochaeta ligniaria NRRL 30616]